MSVWDRLEDVIEAHDGHLELTVAAQCCWSGELRIGLTNPPNTPARSMVFFSAGGASPTQVANRLLAALRSVEPCRMIETIILLTFALALWIWVQMP